MKRFRDEEMKRSFEMSEEEDDEKNFDPFLESLTSGLSSELVTTVEGIFFNQISF
jgi:hypothetical protein